MNPGRRFKYTTSIADRHTQPSKMGFWHILEKAIGYTQPEGNIKESVEAIFDEIKGKDAAIQEFAVDAAVRIAGYMIIAKTFGKDGAIAVKEKEAIEAAFERMERGDFTVASMGAVERETDPHGSSFEVAQAIGGEVAVKTPIGFGERISYSHMHADDTYRYAIGCGFSPNTAKAIAAANVVCRSPSSEGKRKYKKRLDHDIPIRGHHVINNGVRKVFGKTIETFLLWNKDIFSDRQVDDLFQHQQEHRIVQMWRHPFNKCDDTFIQETTVQTPRGETHNDENAAEYGREASGFILVVSCYMTALFLQHVHMEERAYRNKIGRGITECVNRIIGEDFEVYVDSQAYKWWLAEQRGKKQKQNAQDECKRVRNAVARRFSGFMPDNDDQFCSTFAEDFYEVYRKLYNIP